MIASALDAALCYAARGWQVVPMYEPTAEGHCSCRLGPACSHPAKHPRTLHGVHDASSSKPTLRAWLETWPQASVGVVTGRSSDLIVVDIDPRNGGDESLARLEQEVGPLPETVAVATGGGGRHLYFHHPGGSIRNRALRMYRGIDLKGDGGIVVAPPSMHACGLRYRFIAPGSASGYLQISEIANVPLALLTLIKSPDRVRVEPAVRVPLQAPTLYARAALLGECEKVRTAPKGARNDALNAAAFALAQLAGGGEMDVLTIENTLTAAACATGLPRHEISRTLKSGLTAGLAQPRTAPPMTAKTTTSSRRTA